MARPSPGTSTWLTSGDTGDEGSPKASSHEHKGALGLPPVDCASQANTMAIFDVLQPPPLPSVTDIVVTSPPKQEFDVEHISDSLPDTSLGHYDTV